MIGQIKQKQSSENKNEIFIFLKQTYFSSITLYDGGKLSRPA